MSEPAFDIDSHPTDRAFDPKIDLFMGKPSRNRLRDLYSPHWWAWLIPVCPPFVSHQHSKKDCLSPGKVPVEYEWNTRAAERAAGCGDLEPRLEQLEQHLDSGGNVGLALPLGILVLDGDDLESAAWLVDRYPSAPFQRTNAGGHLVQRYDPSKQEIRARTKVEIHPGVVVDLRVGGKSQIVVEPSIHWTGSLYEWGRPL